MIKSEDYRSYLVECVKTALAIEAHFDQANFASIPEITITRLHLPDKETLDHLLDIRVEKLKGEINE